jgi:hypothetical protein
MISIEGIRATGLHLLDVLRQEKSVRYSRFYNDDPLTDVNLARAVVPLMDDPEEGDEEDIREQGHVMLEYAAWQLEDLGIVQITRVDSTLIDGEQDFKIALSDKGEQLSSRDIDFGFRGPDYSINARDASEWLICYLEAAQPREVTLLETMEIGESEGDIVVTDDCKNEYGFGTGSYAWAFEVSLWHHAQRGIIEAWTQSAEETEIWKRFISQKERPNFPSIFEPHPVWQVPLRLTEAFVGSRFQHVGRVS